MSSTAESYPPDCCGMGATIDSVRLAPDRREELVSLLAEQSSIYRGLGAKDAERLRGYILASFETVGLPDAAIPFVAEELDTGLNPYTVAAAAKALRGAEAVPEHIIALLPHAARRIESDDDYVQYESLRGDGAAARTTALAEIFHTVAMLGSGARSLQTELDGFAQRALAFAPEVRAAIELARGSLSNVSAHSCCSGVSAKPSVSRAVPSVALDDLALQDQNGEAFAYRDFFHGRPSVVTFFYTRCMNPEKCSLTISRLARLQRRLHQSELGSAVNLAAFTYDPGYDNPGRLHAYGIERGLRYDARTRLFRTLGPLEPLQAKFNLGVGFGPSTVNRHSVELFVLDSAATVAREFRRVQWDEAVVFAAVQDVAATPIGAI